MNGASGLDSADRALVASTCRRRAALELKGAAAFTVITAALFELRADAEIVELSARAIAEELRHAAIYRALALEYGGAEVPRPRVMPIPVPVHEGVSAPLRAALHVVGMCAINETMACAFLELCLHGATAPSVRDGLREVLADEIRHGRIGWAWLASVAPAQRAQVQPFVLPMLRAQLASWRAQIATLPGGAAPEHGCPSAASIEAAAVASIGELVLPGFDALGVDVTDARSWLAGGARD